MHVLKQPSPLHHRRRALGFSLIEIMVGLVVGLLGIIIVMQMFLNSESSKRTTTGGNDALVNGTIALYDLERDLRSAGHDISAYGILGCSLTFTPSAESTAVTLTMAPITINPATSIIPAADANTDRLLVMSGNSNGSSEGDLLTAISTGTTYVVATPSAFSVDDNLVAQVATRPTPCTLAMSTVTAKSGSSLTLDNGVPSLAIGSLVYNLGPAPVIRAYAVRNGNLTVCDYFVNDCSDAASTTDATVWVPLSSNIVSLRAQYGRDTTNATASPFTMDGVIDTFDQTTPASASDTTGLQPYCSWNRVLAARLALVARSAQFDKTTPTTATLTWAGSTVSTSTTTTSNPTAVTINLTSTAMSGTSTTSQWQNYRYKTVQTVVPLRNTIWQGSQTTWEGGSGGC